MTTLDDNDIAFWLALSEKPWTVPIEVLFEIHREHGSIAPLWQLSDVHLTKIGMSEKSIFSFRRQMPLSEIYEFRSQVDICRKKGIDIIRYVDESYPYQLRNLTKTPGGPPLVLLRRGTLKNFEKCVAIAGTRNASFHGREMAMELARTLASKGYVIVSGLARGTDEWAHFGALKAKMGKTVAVLPWLDPVYPPEHTELLMEIERRGAALSEHYTQRFWKSAKGKFVERNRITSGLSLCVLALESDEEGGTVHQVDLALAQGKKVFALVPKRDERAKRGFEVFLKKGATPLRSVDDAIEYLKDQARFVREARMETFSPDPQGKLETSGTQREDSI